MVFLRLAVVAFLVGASTVPALAVSGGDVCALHVDLSPVAAAGGAPSGGAAPADSTFGLYPMSVLGIANTLRRKGAAIEGTADRAALTTGPLACVVDAIRSWERAYPADPWIAKSLLTLELIYLRPRSGVAHDLAARTEAWLEHDYPQSNYVDPARLALVDAAPGEETVAVAPSVTVARVAAVPAAATRPIATVPTGAVPAAIAASPSVVAPFKAAPIRVAVVPVAPMSIAIIPVDVTPPIIAFSAEPIVVATAPIPPPATLANEFPGIVRLASPWDRFGALVSQTAPLVSK